MKEDEEEFVDCVDVDARCAELKEEGNKLFGVGDYEKASLAYTACVDLEGADKKVRAAAFCNRAACSGKLSKPSSEIIEDCTKALELSDNDYPKALMRRAAAYEADDKLDEALADLEAAGKDTEKLKQKIAERDERLKEEALSKLKDLGNSVLGNFGLSVDNFKLQESGGDGGGYNISYDPKPPSK